MFYTMLRGPLNASLDPCHGSKLLTIQPKWIAKILAGEKVWELRKTVLKKFQGIDIFLVASGRIKPTANVRSWKLRE